MRNALFALFLCVTPALAQPSNVPGLYSRVFYDKAGRAVPTGDMELMPDGKIIENGGHTANWQIKNGYVIVTILDKRFGGAVLQISPGKLEGYNVQKNGDKYKWVMTKIDAAKAKLRGNVEVSFIFRCSTTGEVYSNITLNKVTLIRGGETITARIDKQKAIFENLPLNSKWRMQILYDGTRQVAVEMTVDERTNRSCTIDS